MTDTGEHRHAGEAAGITRWLVIHDDLLRGLAHAMSNRLATIGAVASVLGGGSTPDERFVRGLQQDAGQLEALLQTLRQLPRRDDALPEPMLVADAVETARRLVEHHPDLRAVGVTVKTRNDVVPVLADPAALAHAMVVSLLAAVRNGGAEPDLVITLETIGDEVVVHAGGDVDTPAAATQAVQAAHADRAAIDWLLSGSHGHADPAAPGTVIRLRTLQASRRRAG